MTKYELIRKLADVTGITYDLSRQIVNALRLVADIELRTNGVFAIADLVEVKVVDVPARSGTAMGRAWTKPAHKRLKAKIVGKSRHMFE